MMSRCTTFARSLIKTAALLGPMLAVIPSAPALADSGPQRVIYIFPGVMDNGGVNFTGVATIVECFSFSSVAETLQIIVRNGDGSIVTNATVVLASFGTSAVETHDTNLYNNAVLVLEGTGAVTHGVMGISATTSNIVCTAQVIDASATVPNGIELHGARFNPISGSQE